MRLRATESGGIADVRVLMSHPMETGMRRDAAGAVVPRHYITEVSARVGERVVMTAQWSAAVSTNPFLHFRVRGVRKGDQVVVTWRDSRGESRTDQAVVT
jgi:sulfur-oxidizing protein SoxZ